jgi:hypothetical protein
MDNSDYEKLKIFADNTKFFGKIAEDSFLKANQSDNPDFQTRKFEFVADNVIYSFITDIELLMAMSGSTDYKTFIDDFKKSSPCFLLNNKNRDLLLKQAEEKNKKLSEGLDYNILMGKASSIIEEMKKKKLGNN